MTPIELSNAATAPERFRRPLRICLLSYRSAPFGGGQGIYVRYLSKALTEAGHEVDVVSGEPYPHLVDGVRLIKLPGLNLFENGLHSLRPRHLRSWANIVEWCSKLSGGFAEPYAFGRRAAAFLKEHGAKYDLVHDNQSLAWGLLDIQKQGLPLLVTIHHPIQHDLKLALEAARNAWQRLLVRRWHSFLGMQTRVVRQLQHITTVSECSRQDIVEAFSIDAERVRVIPCGIDTEVFRPLPEIERKPRQLLATVSADQPLKGLHYLLYALRDLRAEFPDLSLTVVGKPKPGGATERLVRRLGLGNELQFVHGISTAELVRLYAETTLAVVPSLYEGFGLPAGEALSCGTPLVSTNAGALPEVVGDAALSVEPGSSRALQAAIRRLLLDEGLRTELSRAGRARIEERFSWAVTAQQLCEFYHDILLQHDEPADIEADPELAHANS